MQVEPSSSQRPPQTLIPLLGHLWFSVSIPIEAHHQLRNAKRKGFVLGGLPRMSCLPRGMETSLHKRMFRTATTPGNTYADATEYRDEAVLPAKS